MARAWRNWAFESAALDLALRQAGLTLPDALGRSVAAGAVRELARARRSAVGRGDRPALRAEPDGRLQARRRRGVERRRSSTSWRRWAASRRSTSRAATACRSRTRTRWWRCTASCWRRSRRRCSRTRTSSPRVEALLEPVRDRVSFDAPIRRAGDITTRTINVKPSRIGGVRPLLEIYKFCAANGVAMYGGGMGELGIGRGQIELLAALFHADAPNDVAPSAFNAAELADGLPASPLVLDGLGARLPLGLRGVGQRGAGRRRGRAPRRRACRTRPPARRPRAAWRGSPVSSPSRDSAIAARGAAPIRRFSVIARRSRSSASSARPSVLARRATKYCAEPMQIPPRATTGNSRAFGASMCAAARRPRGRRGSPPPRTARPPRAS